MAMNLYWLLLITSLNGWKLPYTRFWTRRKLLSLFRLISFVDTGYHMKLSLTMGCISREKQRSWFDSSIFSTINPHPAIHRPMGQLKLQTKIYGKFWRRAQKTTRIGTYNYPMHFGGIGHRFELPQEPLLIHWCTGWKQPFPLKWAFAHWEQY